MTSYKDKIIWITGASSGIGEALVHAFCREGAHVIASARRQTELERVKNDCSKYTGKVSVVVLNLENNDELVAVADDVLKRFSYIDMLINNGGISQRTLIKDTPLDIDRKLMEVNYFSAVTLTKKVLPSMIARQQGHIIATSSIVGKFGFPLRSAYSASKHALHGFFETLRAENVSNNIDVSIIIPGRVTTNISLNAIDKNGKVHGKMDEGQAGGISPEKCATQIMNGLKQKRKEIPTGGKELLMLHIRRFLPFLYYKLVSKISAT